MSSIDSNLLIVICIVAAIVVAILATIMLLASRRADHTRDSGYRDTLPSQPTASVWIPEPLPQPWSGDESTPSDNIDTRIRFGNDAERVAPSAAHVQWGNIESIWVTDSSNKICPVCRNAVNQLIDDQVSHTIKCSNCGTVYHDECWDLVNHHCQICNGT